METDTSSTPTMTKSKMTPEAKVEATEQIFGMLKQCEGQPDVVKRAMAFMLTEIMEKLLNGESTL